MAKKKVDYKVNETHRGGMCRLGDDIDRLTHKLLGDKGLTEIEILANWKHIAGEDLAAYSLPLKVDFKAGSRTNGTLLLACAGGAYALEIQHRTTAIIEKINTFFGYEAVTKIKISQNNFLPQTPERINDEYNPEKKLVTADEKNYIEDVVTDIQDPELKARLQSLGEKVLKANK